MFNDTLSRNIIMAILAAVTMFLIFLMIEPRFMNTEQRAVPKAVSSQQHSVTAHTTLPSKPKHVRKAHRLSPKMQSTQQQLRIITRPFANDALDPNYFLTRQGERLTPDQYPFEQLFQSGSHLFSLPLHHQTSSQVQVELMFDVDLFHPVKNKNDLLVNGTGQPILFQHLGYAQNNSLIHHFTLQYFNHYDFNNIDVLSILKSNKNHIANLGFQQLSTLPNIQDGFIITSHSTYLTAHYVFAGEESMAVVNVISVPLKNVANKRGKPIDTEALEALFTEEVNQLISINPSSNAPIEIKLI